MRITRIKLKNIKCFEEMSVDIPAEPIVYIIGENGSGKSTILDSVMVAVEDNRSTPKGFVRNGAKKGEITIVFDTGAEVVKYLSPSNKVTKLDYIPAPGEERTGTARQVLDTLFGPISINLDRFVKADAKEMRRILLDAQGLTAQVNKLDAQRKEIYDERASVNRNMKKLQGTVDSAIPPAENLPELPHPMKALEEEYRDAVEHNAKKGKLDLQHKHHIERLERKRKERQSIGEEIKRLQATMIDLSTEIDDAVETEGKYAKQIDDFAVIDMGALTAKINAMRHENADIEAASKYREKAADLEQEKIMSGFLTKKIGIIDEKKSDMAKQIPIDGLEVLDDGIAVDGINFEVLNEAQRYEFGCEVAAMMDPELKVIRFPNAGNLDKSTRDGLEELAREKGFTILAEIAIDKGDQVKVVLEAEMEKIRKEAIGSTVDSSMPWEGEIL